MPRPIRPRSLLLIGVFSTACVSNPARTLAPNAEEITIPESTDMSGRDEADGTPRPFLRGTEKLDEEEFYTVIGDTKSAEKVHGRRSKGELLQGLGMTLLATGVAALVGGIGAYALSNKPEGGDAVIPIAEEKRSYLLYSTYVGSALIAGGGYLFAGGRAPARGTPMSYDLEHARAALDKSLYGDKGATPESIKQLSFNTENGEPKLCGSSRMMLTPLKALDEKGRAVRLADHADWFTWSTTPQAELTDFPSADEGKLPSKFLESPLLHSLASLDENLVVTATVQATGLKHELILKHELDCAAALPFLAESGGSGSSGSNGRDGPDRSARDGGNGQDGGDGGEGGRGLTVTAEAAWVTSSTRGRLLLVAAHGPGGLKMALVNPARAVVVMAPGGSGGNGGRGGSGGDGGSGEIGGCNAGGNGGIGGNGGNGGPGGAGGTVKLRLADASLTSLVTADVSGGKGGESGQGGSRGSRGRKGTCKSGYPSDGSDGQKGQGGNNGQDGPSGTSERDIIPASELKLIHAALATNPTLQLEGSGGGAPPRKKKGR